MVGATGIEPIAGWGLRPGFYCVSQHAKPSFTHRFYRMGRQRPQDSPSVRGFRNCRAAPSCVIALRPCVRRSITAASFACEPHRRPRSRKGLPGNQASLPERPTREATVIATPLQRALVAPEHAAHVRDRVEREQVNRTDVGRRDKFCESLCKNASPDGRTVHGASQKELAQQPVVLRYLRDVADDRGLDWNTPRRFSRPATSMLGCARAGETSPSLLNRTLMHGDSDGVLGRTRL